MDAKLFKKLETCNAESAWEKVRDVVAIQLMGTNVFPVPFLRDTASFDLGQVILKGRRTNIEKLTGVQSSALSAGPLSNFVTVDDNLMKRLGSVKKERENRLNQAYEFYESDMKFGIKKTVTVQMWGCQKCAMEYEPKAGDMTVDLLRKGFFNIDRIFLITEVYYATEVKVHVSIADQEDNYLLRGNIPVGFTMLRYKLHKDGTLGSCKKVQTSKWRARWIKNFQRDHNDLLPIDPFPKSSKDPD